MDGIVNVLKPPGMTSFDVVAVLRRLCRERKIGHTGTLDPMAVGVLPVCLGKATRAVEYLTDKDKTYRVELRLGIETDTQDATGSVLNTFPVNVSEEQFREAALSFVGEIDQIPPMYSAVKVGGQKLYDLARKGIEVERQPRKITVHEITVIGFSENWARMDVTCSKGTYIRTLVADIGSKLGCGAHMLTLFRTRSGPYSIEQSVTLEEVAQCSEQEDFTGILFPVDTAFSALPAWCPEEQTLRRLVHGQAVKTELAEGRYRIYTENQAVFAGLASVENTETGNVARTDRLFILPEVVLHRQ